MNITPAALSALAIGDMENFKAASTPGGIEAQEAEGQRTFVANETLPKEMLHGCTKEKLESIGVVFKEDADDIFVNVILPEGWNKQPTEHSMWSDLLDEKGRKRAAIFYKAAFYDRSAHISLERRFHTGHLPEDQYESDMSYEDRKAGKWFGFAKDCGEIIFKTDMLHNPTYEETDVLGLRAEAWLKEQYPDFMDHLAYWD